MERLPCVLRIHGFPVASETHPGGPISPRHFLAGLFDRQLYASLSNRRVHSTSQAYAHSILGTLQSAELKRRLHARKVNAVLVNFGPHAVRIAAACASGNVPLIAHFHGHDAHAQVILAEFKESYIALGEQAAAIIVVSKRMQESLTDLGVPARKIHLARCGADHLAFPLKTHFPAAPVFFAIGRFVEKKAPYLTVLAFANVVAQHPNARLVIAGDGELMEVTRNLVHALKLNHAISFPGVLSQKETQQHMQNATAFVQHSITPRFGPSAGDSEGTPVTVIEAMLSGLPTIATRHAGIKEIINHGKTGLLVEERDTDSMTTAMLNLASSPQYARSLGLAARADAVANHSADEYIRKLLSISEQAASDQAI